MSLKKSWSAAALGCGRIITMTHLRSSLRARQVSGHDFQSCRKCLKILGLQPLSAVEVVVTEFLTRAPLHYPLDYGTGKSFFFGNVNKTNSV